MSAAAQLPPLTNRGGVTTLSSGQPSLAPDWFSCTYYAPHIAIDTVLSLGRIFACRYTRKTGSGTAAVFEEITGFRNGFEQRVSCKIGGKEAASISWGGNSGWVMFDIRGEMCSLLPPETWRFFYKFLRRYESRVTRFDLALDLYNGELTIEQLDNMWAKDGRDVWDYRGKKKPYYQPEGCKELGRTRYICGKRAPAGMCVYEKGMKVLGDLAGEGSIEREAAKEARKWMRCERRWKRVKGQIEVPKDMLLPENWLGYMSGSGPLFRKFLPAVRSLKAKWEPRQKHLEFNLQFRKSVLSLREQRGPLIHFLGVIFGPELAFQIIADETREWSQLERFPGWREDETFMELLTASGLDLIQGKKEFWNDPNNKRLYAIRRWLDKDDGQCMETS